MRVWRLGAAMAIAFLAAAAQSCNPFGTGQDTAATQLVEVTRGDLTVTVRGSGKLEAVNRRKLTFGVSGQVGRIYVVEGQEVAKGDRIASLVTDSLELAVVQAEVAVVQARAGLTQAEVGLRTAESVLNEALGRPTYAEVETAQADVDEAKAYLQYVTSNMGNASPEQQQAWTTALFYARARLAAAQAKLDALVTNYDTEEVAIKRLQVDAAAQSRALAEESLDLARVSLEQARRQMDKATVVAPIGGVLARLNIEEGDTVSPAVVVAEIVDPSNMRLSVQVDEIDVVDVLPGQRAVVEADSLPGVTFEGVVDSISLLPLSQSGIVVYDTRIRFDVPERARLRPGMSASADIVVAERKNVLLIPERAVGNNRSGDTVVAVMVEGQTEERVVSIGVSDGIQIEVVGGLREGDTVVVRRSNQPARGLF